MLVDQNGIVWSEGFGWASKQNEKLLTADSVMQLGSITKLFTAMAIMQLVEQGKVDLDASLTSYLPKFTIQSRFKDSSFTIRQMLTHHSGLPSDLLSGFDIIIGFNGDKSELSDLRNQFNQLPTSVGELHMASKPDYAHSYSNLAYSLLGVVIQRVSGEGYEEYINKHILLPLQMNDSAILLPETKKRLNLANGFKTEGEVNGVFIRDLPAGSLVASANDMGKFLRMVSTDGKGVLSGSSLRDMFTRQNDHVLLGGNFSIGLGFQLSPSGENLSWVGHGGDMAPYHAFLRILPKEGLGIVMMSNSDRAGSVTLGLLSTQILNEAYQATGSGQIPVKVSESKIKQKITLSEKEAKNLTGIYYSSGGIGLIKTNHLLLHLKYILIKKAGFYSSLQKY